LQITGNDKILSYRRTSSADLNTARHYPRQNGVAAALREFGRLERTLFTPDWINDPELRRINGQELNKGESRNSLARAVFIHRLGEIRDRTYENQQYRVSGLNLLVTAIILWNTRPFPTLVTPPGTIKRSFACARRSQQIH
jgi:TnpA family transposase